MALGLTANFFITWTVCFFTTRAIIGCDRGKPSEASLARRHFSWDQPDLMVLRYSAPAVREAIVFPVRLDPVVDCNYIVQALLRQYPGAADPGRPVFGGLIGGKNILETRAGWPFAALVGWRVNANDLQVMNSGASGVLGALEIPRNSNGALVLRLLPYSPIWTGLIANTLLYASVIMGLGMLWSRGRTSLRLRRGVCPSCKYPIGVSEVCTECGVELAESALLRARAQRPEAAR
ncbi:MAG: hypothetical protein V3T53_13680 [Phycisphaerales bacterium]